MKSRHCFCFQFITLYFNGLFEFFLSLMKRYKQIVLMSLSLFQNVCNVCLQSTLLLFLQEPCINKVKLLLITLSKTMKYFHHEQHLQKKKKRWLFFQIVGHISRALGADWVTVYLDPRTPSSAKEKAVIQTRGQESGCFPVLKCTEVPHLYLYGAHKHTAKTLSFIRNIWDLGSS